MFALKSQVFLKKMLENRIDDALRNTESQRFLCVRQRTTPNNFTSFRRVNAIDVGLATISGTAIDNLNIKATRIQECMKHAIGDSFNLKAFHIFIIPFWIGEVNQSQNLFLKNLFPLESMAWLQIIENE